MAQVAEALTVVAELAGSHRTAELPHSLTGTFVINDSDDHEFIFAARGKGRFTIGVDNPGDQILTVQVYGLHAADAAFDDVGSFPLGASWTVGTTTEEYETYNDPFPWYLVRVTSAAAATSSPSANVYVDLSAF